MEQPSEQQQVRLAKVEALRSRGVEPYKLTYPRDRTIGDVIDKYSALGPGESTGDESALAGRLASPIRSHGKAAFADLKDSTGSIQVFARADKLGDRFEDFLELDMGDWVGVGGEIVATKKGELSVDAGTFELLSKALRPWPEKWHGLKDPELRYRRRYLDLATNPRAQEVMQTRIGAVASIRDFLRGRGFVEVETPMLQPVHGGATARPFVTHYNALDSDFYLRIAPELYLKRLLIGGVEKVFEINRNFRNEGLGFQYNPEFTMLEAYEALSDYEGMADLMEMIVREAALAGRGTLQVSWKGEEIDLERPFRRARLIDLVAEAGVDVGGDLAAECDRLAVPYDPKWAWGKLLLELFEKTVEPSIVQPTFVMDYPVEVSPLARRHRRDERFAENLDLTIAGMEIGPAYSELIDPIEQRARFEEQAKAAAAGDEEAHAFDEDFLLALEHGMPPAGGLGMGIDRLLMVLCDASSMREVILFPALRPEQ